MADSQRARRLAEQIQVIVARMLESRIKDPRLGFVTITDARVTGDLQHATIYYTVLGDEKEREDSATALASASGVIRSEVGKQIGIRLTPTVTFVPDSVPEVAASLEEKLREVRARDAELAAASAGATYAGDADPYRTHEDADFEDAEGSDEE
ncbi:MAG: 30S ribosome-binding factor RbfA [bacterium]|nr:30S ribosome-binding factor RbfA [bacterium]